MVTFQDYRDYVERAIEGNAEGIDVEEVARDLWGNSDGIHPDEIDLDIFWATVRRHDSTQQVTTRIQGKFRTSM